MATHGTVSPFYPNKESWTNYAERLDHYFLANDVADAGKKRSILLSACGPQTYKLIRSLIETPATLNTTSYADIVKLVKDHYEPKPSAIVKRFQFNTRVREPGETIASYIAALRELGEHCSYGTSLPEMLRDRLVCGVNHDTIQRKLLGETELTYETALKLSLAIETAEKDTRNLRDCKNSTNPRVNYMATKSTTLTSTRNKRQLPSNQGTLTCYRCGGAHLAPACKFIEAECRYCKKKGHIARVCRSKAQQESKPKAGKQTHYMQEDQDHAHDEDGAYAMFTIRDNASEPIVLEVLLNSVPIEMELDTGASTTIINNSTYQSLFEMEKVTPLSPSTIHLKTYTGQPICVLGTVSVKAKYMGKVADVSIQVVTGDGPNLMGRDMLSQLEVNLGEVNLLTDVIDNPLQRLLNKHSILFNEELGCMKDMKVKLQVDNSAKPKFFKPRSVPFTLKEKVEIELQRLENLGIISPVKFSRWAAPIVPVVKKDGNVRICGDYKVTLNKAALTESYPIPLVDELMADLAGGKYFTKLDMSHAYLQLPLEDESKELVTINTHKGLYKYNRLPFGVSSAPAIFQRSMDTLLRGLNGVSVYLDDILVTGSTPENHLANLDAVLEKLEQAGLRLNQGKCSFLQPNLEYLGHVIDSTGKHPTQDKVRAIKEAPSPRNVTELRSFLGMITYYSKFLSNLSSKLTPLYTLLRKNQRWSWGTKEETAFQLAKDALQTDAVLVHYDSSKPLILACDASQYGIGAVLSHKMENGQERPIAYVSRTLNPAEKRYSQLDKEALAIVSGVKKFHNYLYGRNFIIESDHKPLFYLFHQAKPIPQMASARIQRWALTLAAYNYSIRYKEGKTLCNADALSRLPCTLTTSTDSTAAPAELIHLIEHLDSTCISAANIQDGTTKDPLLSQVRRFIQLGWPEESPGPDYKVYFSKKQELSVLDGCILRGSRVLVPLQYRKSVLEELHRAHPGVTKMKGLARSYVWWPRMDLEIEALVKECTQCQESRPSPSAAPLHPWEWPAKPWSRIHIDFAGPFLGQMFLVIVDAHSKWMDVRIMHSITATKTIEQLKLVFSTHGLPQKLVSDNGPTFTSQEFRDFMTRNGIVHITSAPYHPSTNGLAERAVQSFKLGIERIKGNSIQDRLSTFLFQYRITPHITTGVPPAELLMGRRLRSRLDLLFPDLTPKVQNQQLKQKQSHDSKKPLRTFNVGDLVYAEDFTASPTKWIPGKVVKVTGPLSYSIELSDSTIARRHVDSVRARESSPAISGNTATDPLALPDLHIELPVLPPPPLRRSTRTRNRPDRYGN